MSDDLQRVWKTVQLPVGLDVLAPDGAEIRVLAWPGEKEAAFVAGVW